MFIIEDLSREFLPDNNWILVGDIAVRSAWIGAGLPEPYGTIWVPVMETTKRLEVIVSWLEKWAKVPLLRTSTLVAVGGGVLTDMAGLGAALYMRGISWHTWPTTLLAQVDAGLGGKTGVDLEAGKNLVGAFHSPERMVVCRSFLNTLSSRQLASGCWEIVKTALIFGDYQWAELLLNEEIPKTDIIVRAITAKADIVSRDFFESGERRLLNLGHTLGHALEVQSGYQLSHGESVGFGVLAACCLARHVGLPSFPYSLLQKIGVKLSPFVQLLPPWKNCLEQLYRDKKCITSNNHAKTEIYCILPRPDVTAVQMLLPPEAWYPAYRQMINFATVV